jgi:hypothetical protein
VECSSKIGKLLRVTGGYHLYMSILGVAHPALQPELAGLAMDEPAESHTLHAAFN